MALLLKTPLHGPIPVMASGKTVVGSLTDGQTYGSIPSIPTIAATVRTDDNAEMNDAEACLVPLPATSYG